MLTEQKIIAGIKACRGKKTSAHQHHEPGVSIARLADAIGPYEKVDVVLFRRLIAEGVLTLASHSVYTAVRKSRDVWVPTVAEVPLEYNYADSRFGLTDDGGFIPSEVVQQGSMSSERWRICYEARWYITADGLPKEVRQAIEKRGRAR